MPEWFFTQPDYDPNDINNGFEGIVDGADLSETFEFDYDRLPLIRQVMEAQGFMGKPRVVDASEFGGLARAAIGGIGFVMQRGYGADYWDTLTTYKRCLYAGNWYVQSDDALYGSGMYACGETGCSEPTARTVNVSNSHANMHGLRRRIETMTMDESARLIKYDDLTKMMVDDTRGSLDVRSDEGVYAALRGYDLIYDWPTGQTVVLNRTKLIIANT